jgi:hypothetical protein
MQALVESQQASAQSQAHMAAISMERKNELHAKQMKIIDDKQMFSRVSFMKTIQIMIAK